MPRKYSEGAQKKVERAMHERKHGTLKSGSTGRKVTSRKQAIAIGLSEARREGKKVPPRRAAGRSKSAGGAKKTVSRKSPARRSASRKTAGSRKKKS
ncbi:MAG TPA: DUF6496 domain-containing protein [Bauldia sp.]|nr:DUF6496 domain-containing protein [Bauldia sp.]